MKSLEWLQPEDIDISIEYPKVIERVFRQGLIDLTPWHMMDRDSAKKRLAALRLRYSIKYVPFAWRQDNDDIACIDPQQGQVVVVHDFASEGYERRASFDSFWDWFRVAIEEMISFE